MMQDRQPSSPETLPYLQDGLGLWAERRTQARFDGRPALFLDRDGVVVEECHYLGRAEDVVVLPGIAEAIARVNAAGFPVILATNQAGIARGYYDWHGFSAVQTTLAEALARSGARVDLVLACAYHAEGRAPLAAPDHPWRKPRPGMVDHGADLFAIDRARSHIIGDRLSDLQAGQAGGLGGGTLVRTGHGRGDEAITRAWLSGLGSADRFSGEIRDSAPSAIDEWLGAATEPLVGGPRPVDL